MATVDPNVEPLLPSDDIAKSSRPPGLVSSGLGVAHLDRATRLDADLTTAADKSQALAAGEGGAPTGEDVTFDADDLVRGYRVDVRDDVTATWHSLCKRVGTYTAKATGKTFVIEDEGMITTAVAGLPSSAVPAQPGTDLYLHEGLFTWTGWSLVAPRPGKILPNTTQGDPGPPVDPTPETNGAPLSATFVAQPGTLPRLRFGRTYRFRLRAVDVAGNDMTGGDLDPADLSTASPPTTYRRFDPVTSPILLPTAARTPGETIERLVIRSNYNRGLNRACLRHVAPPKVAQLMAELHGVFDAAGRMSKVVYDLVVARDKATWADRGIAEESDPSQRYYPLPLVQVPYLPDPLARGVSLDGLPGATGTVKIDFNYLKAFPDPTGLVGGVTGAVAAVLGFTGLSAIAQAVWPDAQPFLIHLGEGTLAPQWEPLLRTLSVHLPKGTMAEVDFSCYVNPDDLDLLGVWSLVADAGLSAADLAKQKALAVSGGLGMITPARTMLLVHAVQQPMVPAVPAIGVKSRLVSRHDVTLSGTAAFERHSTGRVDLVGEWTEVTDPLGEPGPVSAPAQAVVTSLPVEYDDAADPTASLLELSPHGSPAGTGLVHAFPDTKHRKVGYHLIATTRYLEYFTQTKDVVLSAGGAVEIDPLGLVAGTVVVTLLNGVSAPLVEGKDFVLNLDLGTIRLPLGSSISGGTTVSVRYVPGPVTRDSLEVAALTELHIDSTAPPAAPLVDYVVPAFDWASTRADSLLTHTITSTRGAGGLRVYLDRPWFSSGDGEQLGVVLWPGGGDVPTNVAQLVSTWGADPIWLGGPVSGDHPLPADLPLAVAPRTGLTLRELPAQPNAVAVAPHDVGYDPERRRWYADLAVKPGSAYFPFVRLALARYQPHSLAGVELSHVVLADFTQLAPGRSATVSSLTLAPQTLKLTVTGVSTRNKTAGATAAGTSQMRATVQKFNPAYSGDLAWSAVTDPVPLTSTGIGGNAFAWSGTLQLPGSRLLNRYRVLVQEFESYAADSADIRTAASASGMAGQRLVYADTIPL
jgi:hypothetical protein